jgi:Undecaprenyl-phosphate galactose phosphotransferase WbaP
MYLPEVSRQLIDPDSVDLRENFKNDEMKREAIPVMPIIAKVGRWLSPLILVVFDYFTITIALLFGFRLRNWILPENLLSIHMFSRYIYLIMPMIYISLIAFEGLYTKRLPLWRKLESLFKVSFFATFLMTGILFFEHNSNYFPRVFLGLSALICFTILNIERYFIKQFLATAGLWRKPMLLVGAGKTAELVAGAFTEDAYVGYQIAGIIDDNHLRPLLQKYRYVGSLSNVEAIVKESRIQDVLIAIPGLAREKLLDIVYRIQPYVKNIYIVPDLYGLPLGNVEVSTYFKQKTMTLTLQNKFLNIWSRFFKRSFDIVAGIIIFIISLPLLIIIGLLIRLDSAGPIVFAHKRVGRKGKVFPCYKFRTMIPNAESVLEKYLAENPEVRQEWEQEFKLKDDPRVTRIGKLLRKTSLDELPQLLNVVKGEMSLVGPRPIVAKEVSKYKEYINDYYMVRPGLTGLWQVSGRNDIDYDSRVLMDSWYVRNWSFWLDIGMLLKTMKVVLKKTGAY